LTHIHGRHTLKIGGDYRVYRHTLLSKTGQTSGTAR